MDIEEFLRSSHKLPVIDVRSPSEYEYGHIPGAVNMPLFSNEERSMIGTLYLKKGSSEAMIRGLEIVGPKMAVFAREGYKIAPNGQALMYCWRGGMRSNSMAWLMKAIGIETHTLSGGYKSFRRQARESLSMPLQMVVIGGMTGTGKTKIIELIKAKGKQVVHLEELAGHKGSVFGGIGLSQQPSTEQFENDLFWQIRQFNPDEPVYIEDESLSIGNVFIPAVFYNQMVISPLIEISMPEERRIQYLTNEYGQANPEELIGAVRKLERRLGLLQASQISNLIENTHIEQAVAMIISYYDKKYIRSMHKHARKEYRKICVTDESFAEIADAVCEMAVDFKSIISKIPNERI